MGRASGMAWGDFAGDAARGGLLGGRGWEVGRRSGPNRKDEHAAPGRARTSRPARDAMLGTGGTGQRSEARGIIYWTAWRQRARVQASGRSDLCAVVGLCEQEIELRRRYRSSPTSQAAGAAATASPLTGWAPGSSVAPREARSQRWHFALPTCASPGSGPLVWTAGTACLRRARALRTPNVPHAQRRAGRRRKLSASRRATERARNTPLRRAVARATTGHKQRARARWPCRQSRSRTKRAEVGSASELIRRNYGGHPDGDRRGAKVGAWKRRYPNRSSSGLDGNAHLGAMGIAGSSRPLRRVRQTGLHPAQASLRPSPTTRTAGKKPPPCAPRLRSPACTPSPTAASRSKSP